ncbi:MAG: hypothetical protein JW919_02250 [Candidatus Omnitrophica bacterium]|nr:hypothetical protein [Candidatus Omnitrophota bacterium]
MSDQEIINIGNFLAEKLPLGPNAESLEKLKKTLSEKEKRLVGVRAVALDILRQELKSRNSSRTFWQNLRWMAGSACNTVSGAVNTQQAYHQQLMLSQQKYTASYLSMPTTRNVYGRSGNYIGQVRDDGSSTTFTDKYGQQQYKIDK